MKRVVTRVKKMAKDYGPQLRHVPHRTRALFLSAIDKRRIHERTCGRQGPYEGAISLGQSASAPSAALRRPHGPLHDWV